LDRTGILPKEQQMKKVLAGLILCTAILVPAFTQMEVGVSFDPVPLITGLVLGDFGISTGFEYASARAVSTKINVYYLGMNIAAFTDLTDGTDLKISLFRVNLEGRWYPEAEYIKGFFLNGGLQYHLMSGIAKIVDENGSLIGGSGNLNTLGLYGGIGYKIIFGSTQKVGFFLEPAMDFIWPLYSDIPFTEIKPLAISNYLGWIMGVKLFRFGLIMGAAF
jgi:hypothetical protein